MPGRLIAVVGPSGVGKDSLMRGLADTGAGYSLVTRVITRPAELGGEVFVPVSAEKFAEIQAEGGFCLHWNAHGLHYGIPVGVLDEVRAGRHLLVNLSRGVLPEAREKFPDLCILSLTARPEVLARRLANRGRESETEITRRLERATMPLPAGDDVLELANDGPLEETLARARALLQPERA